MDGVYYVKMYVAIVLCTMYTYIVPLYVHRVSYRCANNIAVALLHRTSTGMMYMYTVHSTRIMMYDVQGRRTGYR